MIVSGYFSKSQRTELLKFGCVCRIAKRRGQHTHDFTSVGLCGRLAFAANEQVLAKYGK